ncbi:Dickkopf_N domain-containing protein [Durusdinium trenchii]|uniref:Dickkopf_N domain-containing protein n=1 Tax=Durusdinium trenchii TaxID=1381693 RepID=A0ABP0HWZ3_9DINO
MPELQNVLVFVPASIDEDGAMKILQPFQSHFGQLEAPLGSVAPMHLFRVLDVKGRGFLWPKDLARLAWAMEPNLGFQDKQSRQSGGMRHVALELSAFWRLLGGEGDRLRPRPFCRALQVAVSPTSPTSKPSKPTWRQIGRSYAAQPSRALSFAPTAVSAQQALEAFVQKWKPKSKLAAKAGAPPGAPPSAPPAPGAPPMAASAAPGSASYSSEDFEEDRYSEGTRYTDSSSGKGSK